jgi:hypothetical protein
MVHSFASGGMMRSFEKNNFCMNCYLYIGMSYVAALLCKLFIGQQRSCAGNKTKKEKETSETSRAFHSARLLLDLAGSWEP